MFCCGCKLWVCEFIVLRFSSIGVVCEFLVVRFFSDVVVCEFVVLLLLCVYVDIAVSFV